MISEDSLPEIILLRHSTLKQDNVYRKTIEDYRDKARNLPNYLPTFVLKNSRASLQENVHFHVIDVILAVMPTVLSFFLSYDGLTGFSAQRERPPFP